MAENRSSLRILYSFPHPLGSPGIGTTAWHQVDQLSRAGHRVHVLTTRTSGATPAGVTVRTTLPSVPGRALGRVMGVDRAMAFHDAATARALALSRAPYDLVHTWPSAALQTVRAAARRGVTSVRELPNSHTEHAYEVAAEESAAVGIGLDPRAPHAFHARRLAREMLEYAEATALLAPSDVVVRSFTERGFDPRRVLRHRYGFDPEHFRLERARARPPSPDGGLRVLFVGRAEPRKGLHLALRAWHASHASARGVFTVCGAFAPGYREALSGLLDHPRVRVVGVVRDPSELYAEHDVLVLPSVEEGSALVTYEAAAMGCVPLVSSASGAACEDGVDGLTHPVRAWAVLAKHLDVVADQPEFLTTLRERCLARRDELTWRAGTAMTIEAYRRAMALGRPVLTAGPAR